MKYKLVDETYCSPRLTGEVSDCSMPMTFDQHNNCGFSCLYCFSTFQREMKGPAKSSSGSGRGDQYLNRENIKGIHLEAFKRMFDPERPSTFRKYIDNKMVMQWGGLSDPFCPIEYSTGLGLKILRFLRKIDYPICFSTKGTWWLDDERYTELFKDNPNWNVKFSIITLDEQKARIIEKGVPTPKKRLQAIEKMAKLNSGGATLRLRPFMVGISSPTHLELIRLASEAGATALSTEFFCLERRSKTLKERLNTISKVSEIDYLKFYKRYSQNKAGYLRLNRNVKRPYIYEMRDLCKELGVRFYVSDAHFKECSANGSCCGLPPDWNYSRGQFTEALLICKEKGKVTWDDIEKHMDHLDNGRTVGASGYHLSGDERFVYRFFGLKDLLRHWWNHPKKGQSPYTMFGGIMMPTHLDDKGNLVYEYDKRRE